MSDKDYEKALAEFLPNAEVEDTGLYIHFPFCPEQCYFCICNVNISKDREKINSFVQYILHEIDLLFDFFNKHKQRLRITDIHVGGGTPSYMTSEELSLLTDKLKQWIDWKEVEELSIEFDPRSASYEKFKLCRDLGFNRVSMGVQDFENKIQEAVNRVHSFEMIQSLLTTEVRSFFKGINFDVLYGLPMQTRESFKKTLELVQKLSPDRVTLLKYAHVPDVNKHMKVLNKYEMPEESEKARLFFDAIDSFRENGWEHIGIDHFAKKTDSLTVAQHSDSLKRTFIGFQSGKLNNLLGIGPSSTIKLNNYYFQNTCNLEDYVERVNSDRFPIGNGYKLTEDDMLRREIIEKILCESCVRFEEIGNKHKIDFCAYFGKELEEIKEFIENGIVERTDFGVELTDLGKGFKRQVCRVFDKFFQVEQDYKIHGTGNKKTRLTL